MVKHLLRPQSLAVAFLSVSLPAWAGPMPGAIFTTVKDGTEVNLNQYPAKEDVYLDGGPGVNAPQFAAGLDDGVYVFQVTDPSGKTLLSTDLAGCRQFTVENGIITSVAVAGSCAHQTGNDVDHPPAITVQLMPYNDTPNPGGVYKVWVTPLSWYQCSLGKVECKVRGAVHGFIPSWSKTDNFKIRQGPPRELDTVFLDESGNPIDALGELYIDPLGASNQKYSVWNPDILAFHEAHVENIENGLHQIYVYDQPGCRVGAINAWGRWLPSTGPQMVSIHVTASFTGDTIFVYVYCDTSYTGP